jgi:hypothetical protein
VEANAVSVILSNIEPVACTNGAARLDLDTIDVTWEEIQESALRAYHTGRIELASRNWERAMVLARRHFGPADPRLATSLTNHGFVLRCRTERYEAERHLRQATLTTPSPPRRGPGSTRSSIRGTPRPSVSTSTIGCRSTGCIYGRSIGLPCSATCAS